MIFSIRHSAYGQKETFIRVFNAQGQKFHKGFLFSTSDSSVSISKHKKKIEIPITEVSEIKVRHSFVGAVLVTTIGITAGLFILGDLEFLNVAVWSSVGAILCGITKRPALSINGSTVNWFNEKDKLKRYLPRPYKKLF